MKYKGMLLNIVIVVGLFTKPLFSTAIGSENFEESSSIVLANFKERKENEASTGDLNLVMVESNHGSGDLPNKGKLDKIPTDEKNMMSEIQMLNKIVSELRSNDREMKNEMNQLNGRVSRLESSTSFEEELSTAENKHRSKRQISNTTNDLRPVCSKTACAFDFGRENWVKPTIPTSCKDLLKMGHVLNGFYPIKTKDQIKLVFCNFNSPQIEGMESAVGFVDIKSSPVYFFVQKSEALYSVVGAPMPFETMKLNVGNAMDLKTGIFTAPKTGIYYFAYSGIKDWYAESAFLYLQLNGSNVAVAHASSITGGLTMALHSTLKLQMGDKISLVLTRGIINNQVTTISSFIGFLLEEYDLVI